MQCLGLKAHIERLIAKSKNKIRFQYYKKKYYLWRDFDYTDFAFKLCESENNYHLRDSNRKVKQLDHIELIEFITKFVNHK